MTESGPLPRIALALAGLAVVLAGIAIVVVATRHPRAPAAAAAPHRAPDRVAVAAPAPGAALPPSHRVPAVEVVKLKHDPDIVTQQGITGLRVADDPLRTTLGLEPGDLITAIAGRKIEKSFDLYDVLLGTSMMNATTFYVEVQRAGAPVLLRWQIVGDLRTARYADIDPPVGGRLGQLGSPPPPLPALPPVAPDSLAATVVKIDDHTYEVPRSTLDAVLSNPLAAGKSLRVVPAIKSGVAVGFKLYAIRPSSFFAAIGLQNGDTLASLNHQAMTTPDAALEVYASLKSLDHLVIELERRGRPVTLSIKITR